MPSRHIDKTYKDSPVQIKNLLKIARRSLKKCKDINFQKTTLDKLNDMFTVLLTEKSAAIAPTIEEELANFREQLTDGRFTLQIFAKKLMIAIQGRRNNQEQLEVLLFYSYQVSNQSIHSPGTSNTSGSYNAINKQLPITADTHKSENKDVITLIEGDKCKSLVWRHDNSEVDFNEIPTKEQLKKGTVAYFEHGTVYYPPPLHRLR